MESNTAGHIGIYSCKLLTGVQCIAVVRLPYWKGEGLDRKPHFKAIVRFPRSPVMRGNCTNQIVIVICYFV